jgi:hypothetical protein
MTTIPSTRTAPWAICHRSCFGKEDRQPKTAGGTGIRGQDQSERARAEDIELDGDFFVLGNRTDISTGFRISVRRMSDSLNVKADVPMELPHEQKLLIQEAEWQKVPIYLSMNASMLRGAISQAVVLSAAKINTEEI